MPRFARGAMSWILGPLLLTVALLGIGLTVGPPGFVWFALPPALVFLFFLQFFRDPERAVAEGVASPADGKVVRRDEVDDEDLGRVERFSIFMSPKDVHVNRFPLDAKVVAVNHIAGGHIPAFKKDSHRNERVEWLLDTGLGPMKVIQIAGTVARRIVPYLEGGETVHKGDRMGLIRLGSRCDVLVPPGRVRWTVELGTQVYGGKTSIGEAVAVPRKAKSATPKPAANGTKDAAKRGMAATKGTGSNAATKGTMGKGGRT